MGTFPQHQRAFAAIRLPTSKGTPFPSPLDPLPGVEIMPVGGWGGRGTGDVGKDPALPLRFVKTQSACRTGTYVVQQLRDSRNSCGGRGGRSQQAGGASPPGRRKLGGGECTLC